MKKLILKKASFGKLFSLTFLLLISHTSGFAQGLWNFDSTTENWNVSSKTLPAPSPVGPNVASQKDGDLVVNFVEGNDSNPPIFNNAANLDLDVPGNEVNYLEIRLKNNSYANYIRFFNDNSTTNTSYKSVNVTTFDTDYNTYYVDIRSWKGKVDYLSINLRRYVTTIKPFRKYAGMSIQIDYIKPLKDLPVPIKNIFNFNTVGDREGFTVVSRATATQETTDGRGVLKFSPTNFNSAGSRVALTNQLRVDGYATKYAHVVLKNTSSNSSFRLFGVKGSTSTSFTPTQVFTTNDTDYKTYDFDLGQWFGDQQPELAFAVKDTWSATATYAVGDIVIVSSTYYKNVLGTNSATAAAVTTETDKWVIVNAAGEPAPALGAVSGGAIDIVNSIFIDSIVFDNARYNIASNGTGGGNWLETTTWSGGLIPTDLDNAIIMPNDLVTLSGTAAGETCSNLIIKTNGTLSIPSNKTLTIKNAIVNDGVLTVENNANLLQTNNGANSGLGSTIVKRNSSSLFVKDFSLWCSPVFGTQKLEGFSPLTATTPNGFLKYDSATNSFVAETSTNTFSTGVGYLIGMPKEGSANYNAGTETAVFAGAFTGTSNNGSITQDIVSDTYYAIGNPYPSTISADAFLDRNSTDGALYFWRKSNTATGSAYAAYTRAGSTATAAGAGELGKPNGTIQTGQGFIVKSGLDADTFTFTNAMRLGTYTNQFFKTQQLAVEKSRLWLNLTNASGAFSQTLVAYMDGATTAVDNAIDGKYFNDSPIALTSIIANGEYTIQGRPAFDATDVVVLGFKTDLAGDYTIALDSFDGIFSSGQAIYLIDSKTGVETNLKEGSYTFTASTGADTSRFTLKYQKTLKVDAPLFNENAITVYKNNGTLYINSAATAIKSVQVYDIQGRLIAEQKNVKAQKASISNLKATNQVLIVKVTAEDNQTATKKVVY
jgi:hypothetical protein